MDIKRSKLKKKGQEEIVGFALIIIIATVMILFLLSFSLRSNKKENVESPELTSFVQASLQYTTTCEVNSNNLSVQNLVFECIDNGLCSDNRDSCAVLNSTLAGIVGEGWKVGLDRPVKGYELLVRGNNNSIVAISEGNVTANYKGALQDLARGSSSIEITLKIYY